MQYDIIPHITLKPNRYKNSSDISLVLGAADVLINNIKHPETACDTVIIVSSDCDFSPLATRLRREGLRVICIMTAHCFISWTRGRGRLSDYCIFRQDDI